MTAKEIVQTIVEEYNFARERLLDSDSESINTYTRRKNEVNVLLRILNIINMYESERRVDFVLEQGVFKARLLDSYKFKSVQETILCMVIDEYNYEASRIDIRGIEREGRTRALKRVLKLITKDKEFGIDWFIGLREDGTKYVKCKRVSGKGF